MDSNGPSITVTKEERGRSGTTAVVSQDEDVDPIPVGNKQLPPLLLVEPPFYMLASIFTTARCLAARRLHSKHNQISHLLPVGNYSSVPRLARSLLAPTTVDLVDLLEVPARPCGVCCC